MFLSMTIGISILILKNIVSKEWMETFTIDQKQTNKKIPKTPLHCYEHSGSVIDWYPGDRMKNGYAILSMC